MTNQDYINRGLVVRMMTATARNNGKKADLVTMLAVARRLHRLEATLSRLACDQCNYPVYDAAKQTRLEKLALSIIAEAIGCKAYTQRDPRGYCIRLYLQDTDGRPWFNSWDGETVGLNW